MVDKESVLRAHSRRNGKYEIISKVALDTADDLSTYYTPGVAYACDEIKANREKSFDYTTKGNTIAIISDGTRILGLGNIGPEAGLPVMEGKAILFKKYGGVDAIPICVGTTDENEIVKLVKDLAPTFGAVNMEDIETPKVLRIVERLTRELDIPVFHDDSKGVAVVTLAGLINALKLAGKGKDARIVIDGAGSAGYGIVELFHAYGLRNMVVLDSKGIIYSGRHGSNEFKEKMAGMTKGSGPGSLADAVKGADVLIGVSTKGSFDGNLIRTMADKPIVFALTNPDPEISYEDAKSAGAFIVATGRSDTPNQINNSLVFPGVMRGLLDVRAKAVSDGMLLKAATTIARLVGKELSQEKIVPTMADTKSSYKVAANVAHAVAHQAIAEGLARTTMTADQVKKHLKEQMRVYSRFEKRIPK